jgi:hypothetical protein
MGTEFTIFDKGAKPGRVEIDPNRSSDSSEAQYSNNNATAPGQLPPRTELGAVRYEYNVLGTKGPRVMSGAIPKVDPVSLRRGTALRAFPTPKIHPPCFTSNAGDCCTYIAIYSSCEGTDNLCSDCSDRLR